MCPSANDPEFLKELCPEETLSYLIMFYPALELTKLVPLFPILVLVE
jgi:hypothetical protein